MKKIIIGGILGGLIYFIWGSVSWMVLPWHNATLRELPNEDVVTEALRRNVTEPGVYVFPAWPKSHGDPAACDAFAAKHKQGPIGTMIYHAEGMELAMGPTMIRGLVLNIVSALLIAYLLSRAVSKSYAHRVCFVSVAGLFAGLTTHGMYWNWMLFPCDYTAVMIADTFMGWTLAGLVMAAVGTPAPTRPAVVSSVAGVVDPG